MDAEVEQSGLEAGNLRFLRVLVTVLTLTMIGGLIAVFTVIVIRFPSTQPMVLPDTVELPEGVTAEAVTFGGDWLAVVAGDEILIYGRETGALRQRIQIEGE